MTTNSLLSGTGTRTVAGAGKVRWHPEARQHSLPGMNTPPADESVVQRLDRLYEYDREPVAESQLHGGAHFAGMYAGEHVAATEFVIGALFVSWGARAGDVLIGLLLGNLMAVLSWTLVCAPIAPKHA